jgi:hypothetical protein
VIDSDAVMSTLSHDRESEWGARGIESGLNPFDYWKKKEERFCSPSLPPFPFFFLSTFFLSYPPFFEPVF